MHSNLWLSVFYLNLHHYGHFGSFFLVALESLGVPFLSDLGYLLAASLTLNWSSYILSIGALTLGSVTGSALAYLLGRGGGGWLRNFIGQRPGFKRAHGFFMRWYQRYGSLTVFGSRFVGYVRPWSSYTAGFSEFSFSLFLGWTFLGSAIFNSLAVIFYIFLVDAWRGRRFYHTPDNLLFVLAGLILAIVVFIYLLRGKSRKMVQSPEK